jgi:hypothetical protein
VPVGLWCQRVPVGLWGDVLNRAQRRRAERIELRKMREEGCTCRPDITDTPKAEWPTGTVDMVYVRHQTGCAFGDRVFRDFNTLGIVPAFGYRTKGCTR